MSDCFSYIGYENLFESGTVTTSSEQSGFEKENAYDWRPYDFWAPDSSPVADEWVAVDLGSSESADYFAMHAYDLDGGTVVLQYSDTGSESDWADAFTPESPAGVYFKLFAAESHRYWRVLVSGHDASPQIGVVAFGSRLAIRGQQPGFVPPTLGRDTRLVANQSDSGNFLGQSVVRSGTKFELQWKAMTAAEARSDWLPFIVHAESKPFFFLWSENYTDEAAFVWAEGGHEETPYLTVNRLDGRIQCRGVSSPLTIHIPNPIPALSPAAYFKFNTGITESGGAVSQWDDQSGNGRHLLQATATNQPALQGDGSILFDGVDNFMKCAAFTLNQPTTVYIRFKQVTWTIHDRVFDGDTNDKGILYQVAASPILAIYAGTNAASNNNLAVNTYGSVAVVFNSANSLIQVGDTTPTTGNASINNMGGFTLGARGDGGALRSNIQVKEVVLFPVTHDAATRASVIAYLDTL